MGLPSDLRVSGDSPEHRLWQRIGLSKNFIRVNTNVESLKRASPDEEEVGHAPIGC